MAEYSALIGLGRRFGTPWRPVEQGLIESRHLETQKVMGMLVKDIMQCFPNETGELTHVVEFIVYNTPGPHGYTPRDIDRRWSLSTPLEKELQPFAVSQFEPVSDYIKTLFRNYREIRVRVLGWLKDSSEKRADLANRFRRSKRISIGDEVVVRDPRQRKAGGRSPYRQPYTEPALVLEVHGNKCSLRTKDNTVLRDIHLEDVMKVPENSRNFEKRPIEFPDEEDLALDTLEDRRSPGMMLEDEGKKVEAQAKAFADARKGISPGKLDKVTTGNFVVYVLSDKVKECTIGKVTALSKTEQSVIVHRYRPVTDNHLRLYWQPVYVEGGIEVLGNGSHPSTETVNLKRLLFPVQLHDGVLAHAAARRLDHAGYRYERSVVCDLNGDPVVHQDSLPGVPSLEPAAGAELRIALKSGDGESFSEKVEKFCRAGRAIPSVGDAPTGHPVHFSGRTELQKWLQLGFVDFAELFRGFGEATDRVREAGCTASEGFDKYVRQICYHV